MREVFSLRRLEDAEIAAQFVSPMSNSECRTVYSDEMQLYCLLVSGSVGLTVFVFLVYHLLLKALLNGSPALASQFFFVSGIVKIAVGVIIAVFFIPTCPQTCSYSSCSSSSNGDLQLYLYSAVAILVGLRWWKQAQSLRQRAALLEVCYSSSLNGYVGESIPTYSNDKGQSDKHDSPAAIFQPVSSVEIA
jgi:hypothetical protein